MDIVKRAYLNVKRETSTSVVHNRVYREVIRLIQAGGYSPKDWPTELGPYPDELKKTSRIEQTRGQWGR